MMEAPQEPPPRMPQSSSSLTRAGVKTSRITLLDCVSFYWCVV